jgi:hypothetical protein
MKSVAVKFLLPASAAVVLGLVAVALPAASEPEAAPVVLQTALLGIAPQETLVVRALETRQGTTRLEIVFLNERNEVVRRVFESFGPGRPAKATLSHADLGSSDELPAVQVKMILRRPPSTSGDASRSRPLLSMQFFNVNTLVAREGPTCAPPHRPGVDFNCPPGDIVGASSFTAAGR